MKIGIPLILISIGANFLVSSAVLAAECLDYEPAVVTLRGSVALVPAYGPPGFGEDPQHDAHEDYLALNFKSPACINASSDRLTENVAETDIGKMQLAFGSDEAFQQAKRWMGKTIVVTGSLYHAVNGHHHTAVMLKVTEIEEASKAR